MSRIIIIGPIPIVLIKPTTKNLVATPTVELLTTILILLVHIL